MLKFSPICLEDSRALSDLLRQSPPFSADYTFSNLYAWRKLFHTECAFEGGTCLIRFRHLHQTVSGYMMPIGPEVKALAAVEQLVEDAAMRGKPFLMKGVTLSMRESLEAAYPNRFLFTPDPGNNEYIYRTEKLATLSGKKLQSKRNHIHRFKKEYPEWKYIRLESNRETRECLVMLDQWMHTFPADTAAGRRHDYHATRVMLRHLRCFGLSGGMIKIGSRVVAFTLGEALGEDTFVVHVEKAFAGVPGAYALINQQFALWEVKDRYTFINREEDMGLENIRKAKLSYHPERLLEHFAVTLP
jgi:hypothetical protein